VKTYSVWYLASHSGVYEPTLAAFKITAKDIREAAAKLRRKTDRHDYFISCEGRPHLKKGGGPLVLLAKKTEGKPNYMHIKLLGTTPMGVKT